MMVVGMMVRMVVKKVVMMVVKMGMVLVCFKADGFGIYLQSSAHSVLLLFSLEKILPFCTSSCILR